MHARSGFTITELVLLITLLTIGTGIYLFQKQTLEAASRDDQRKTAINAIDYALRKEYFPSHKSYPRTLTEKTLTTLDPSLLTDPSGRMIDTTQSDYRYEAAQCTGEACLSYTLRADLEREADYTVNSTD